MSRANRATYLCSTSAWYIAHRG